MALQGKDVMRDPKNGLGDAYDPSRVYALVTPKLFHRRLREGWRVEDEEVLDHDGPLILISKPK